MNLPDNSSEGHGSRVILVAGALIVGRYETHAEVMSFAIATIRWHCDCRCNRKRTRTPGAAAAPTASKDKYCRLGYQTPCGSCSVPLLWFGFSKLQVMAVEYYASSHTTRRCLQKKSRHAGTSEKHLCRIDGKFLINDLALAERLYWNITHFAQ